MTRGDYEAAIASLSSALSLDDSFTLARRYLAVLLVRAGRSAESLPLFRTELASEEGHTWMRDVATTAMRSPDLSSAGAYAAIAAELRWGTPSLNGSEISPPLPDIPMIPLSVPKLRHDANQLSYLQTVGILDSQFDTYISRYRDIAHTLAADGGPDARAVPDDDSYQLIRDIYNRLLYVRPTPRVERALSKAWSPAAIEDEYIQRRPGIAVIDQFLTRDALDELRAFCVESTVWFHNRYAHGRLGAFFQDGFNSALLLQIAEEVRAALPRVIGDRYPLRQMWGFKNSLPLPAGVTTHADFAAVNVNFWITPEEANLDDSTGGLVLYDVDAPMHWDFDTYNGSDSVGAYLRNQRSKNVTIPYRQNRAIIFNSDLFHATDAVNFRDDYSSHRINVTMLYGDREEDTHHPQPARSQTWASSASRNLRKARS